MLLYIIVEWKAALSDKVKQQLDTVLCLFDHCGGEYSSSAEETPTLCVVGETLILYLV